MEEKQSFYDELKDEWDMHSADDLVVCLGDFMEDFLNLERTTFLCFVSSIPSLLLMVQRDPPQAVWYHLALS